MSKDIKELHNKVGKVSAVVRKAILSSGLTWDEAVFALGLVSKMLAMEAHKHGDESKENCTALAQSRLSQGFAQEVVMISGKRH